MPAMSGVEAAASGVSIGSPGAAEGRLALAAARLGSGFANAMPVALPARRADAV